MTSGTIYSTARRTLWADVEKVCIQNQAIIVHLVCAGHDGLGFRQPTLL